MTQKIKEVVTVGRRKTAVATVRLRPASKNEFTINDKKFEEYFPMQALVDVSLSPLKLTELLESFDILVRVKGGGVVAQAEAVRLGIARAIVKEHIHHRPTLKAEGFLRRDPRKKERKKYGQPGARKRFQFSKR